MRTGDLYRLDQGPRLPDHLRQPEGSGSPAEPGAQAGRVTREPAARGRRADPAAAGWWCQAWSVRRPHRRDLGPSRGLGVELDRAGQGRPICADQLPGPHPRSSCCCPHRWSGPIGDRRSACLEYRMVVLDTGRLPPAGVGGFVTAVTAAPPASAGGSGPASLATPRTRWPRERQK